MSEMSKIKSGLYKKVFITKKGYLTYRGRPFIRIVYYIKWYILKVVHHSACIQIFISLCIFFGSSSNSNSISGSSNSNSNGSSNSSSSSSSNCRRGVHHSALRNFSFKYISRQSVRNVLHHP